MVAMMMIYTSFCWLYVLFFLSLEVYSKCLQDKDDTKQIKRHLYFHGNRQEIVLESSQRTSHAIVNHILKILLEEVIGYEDVTIREKQDTMNFTAILNRLSGCKQENCENVTFDEQLPETMINLEVWMMAGFNMQHWLDTGRVTDAGTLGSYGRLGWYMPTYTVNKLWQDKIIADHWRGLSLPAVIRNFSLAEQMEKIKTLTFKKDGSHYCTSPDCIDGIYYGPKCSPTNMYACSTLLTSFPDVDLDVLKSQVRNLSLPVNIVWIGDNLKEFVLQRVNQNLPVLFFSWQPHILTADSNFTRVKFPMCQNNFNLPSANCDFDGSQFHKIVWSKIKTNIPEGYHMITHMKFSQVEYERLLQNFHALPSAFDIACDWVHKNSDTWEKWLPQNLSNKTKVYLGGLFPISGLYWMEPGLVQGAELALSLVNESPYVLPEHSLELIISNSECLPDVAMKAFIKHITNTSVPVIGILGPGCSDEAEPIAALSRHFNMLVISYGAEASSLSDRTKYPYFYRTIPQVNHHRYVYEKFFKAMEWKQIGAIAEGGQEFPEYHLLLQDHLHQKGISVVVKRNIVRRSDTLDVSQIFADLRAQNVRVIIADFFVFAARAVMCEAYRQRMTAHEGYVWFLPAWYPNDWWDVEYYNNPPSLGDPRPQEHVPCSTEQMEYAVDGHFILSKTFSDSDDTMVIGGITVGQYKQQYKLGVGKADLDGTPFASYVYDAVWVYALALDRLLKSRPGALENLHSKENTDYFIKEVNRTDFQGVSGRIRFEGGDRPGTIIIQQFFLNETRIVGRYTPKSGETEGELEIYNARIRWLTPSGVKPSDGNPETENCMIENFRALFNVKCEIAIVIANVMGFGGFILVLLVILIIIKYRYDAKVRATHQRMKELGLLSSDYSQCFSLDEWEVSRENVVLNRKLGEGAFGTVYGGEAIINDIDDEGWSAVAVKTLKVGSTVQEKVDFLSEAEVMKRFNHPNIVQLLGVTTRGEPVYTIMEFLLHGDLKTYLLSRRNLVGQDAKESEDVSPQRLTQMALDVAYGLKYIHDLKYVHRDLACRNCLVHSNQTVKIGDFGMTRPTTDSDYYRFHKRGMLPVRWMSPESLWDGLFTYKSDVWSYGVLLYEIVTFGSFPYQGLSNSQVLEYVKSRGRLTLPRYMSDELASFIYSCLAYEPNDRPDMEDIIDMLMKNPEFLKPCLDAPTTSVVIEDSEALELPTHSVQNTVTQSHSNSFTTFLNRRSIHGSSSQEKLSALKRLSGTPSGKPPTYKSTIKTFIPAMIGGRQRSNSIGTPQAMYKDKYSSYQDNINCSNSPPSKANPNRHSEEIPNSSYNTYIPLLANNGQWAYDDNSEEVCQTVTSV
ncbi:hypothetical protein CHS0354_017444 [Potamilus streckersoni]|uniref:Protein kinase domain-containing protein n=1 Tax=Potamilus streckersoni TaxID=2493646 RepID=A0AAE0SBQ2_9BIVA|nr:hypothetical protein CHS0354_017444 [Potamilus streckersoni]